MPRRRCKPGFTVAELIMAVGVTAIIGVGIAGVAMALSTAHEHGKNYGENMQEARCVTRRIGRGVRGAHLVTCVDSDGMVFWAGDDNADGKINVSEIAILLAPSNDFAGQLREFRVEFPDDMAANTRLALDVAKPLSSLGTTSGAYGMLHSEYPGYRQVRSLCENVLEWRVAVDVNPPMTRRVEAELRVGSDRRWVPVHISASLRADRTSWVCVDEGTYVLVSPEE